MNLFKAFWPYCRIYKRRIVVALVFLTFSQLVGTSIPIALKMAVDTIKEGLDHVGLVEAVLRDIAYFTGIILGLSVLQMGCQMGMRWYMGSTARYAEKDIRKNFFEHLLRLSPNFFHKTPTGDLMARATNDIEAVRFFLGFGLRMLYDAILAICMGFAVMCTIDWELAIYAVVPMPLLALVMSRIAGGIHGGFRDVQEQFSNISARIQENLSGMRVVKAYVQREGEMEAFDHLNRGYLEKSRKLIYIQSVLRPLAYLISGGSLVIILWLGGHKVIQEEITLGSFVAFNAYLTKLIFPMILLGWMADRYQRARASMERIQGILAIEPDIRDIQSVRDLKEVKGKCDFQKVSVVINGVAILKDIDLQIQSGSTLAIVGRVGSGKTTIGRLIPRMIQANRGMVLIDGMAVDQIPLQVLRSAIGYVPQDTFLFSDTLRNNISLGMETASEEDIMWAAEVSQLSKDFSDFPTGLDTVIGERGVTLSGGQKQRTAIARAVIRRPKILILDDAMASVDTNTEQEIMSQLQDVMAQSTTILISHRISTVQSADQIIAINEGRIVEKGTHTDLVAQGGIYAEMYRYQQLTQELREF